MGNRHAMKKNGAGGPSSDSGLSDLIDRYVLRLQREQTSYLEAVARRELAKGFAVGDMHLEHGAWPGTAINLMVRHRSGWRCAASSRIMEIAGAFFHVAVDPDLPPSGVRLTDPGGRIEAVWDGHLWKYPGKPDPDLEVVE